MSTARQFAGGLVIALFSMVLIGTSLISASSENRLILDLPTDRPTEAATPTNPVATLPVIPSETAVPPTDEPPPPPTQAPSVCSIPGGWIAYTILPGDKLETIAAAAGLSGEELMAANCLPAGQFIEGAVIYIPPPAIPTPTQTATTPPSSTPAPGVTPPPTTISCGPPVTWVRYTVRSGDTLYSLGQIYGVTVRQLQAANCLGSSTYIRAGDLLWVPYFATHTPTVTPTWTFTPTPTRTPAGLTPTVVGTLPSSPTATWTPSPSATNTFTPTFTPLPTNTPSPTATSPPIETPTPTFTPETPEGTSSSGDTS